MAQRQTHYNNMSAQEQAEQEYWTQEQLRNNEICVAGFAWRRQENGYQCMGGTHFTTDELLAEGRRGYYQKNLFRPGHWIGPKYPGSYGY
jgi:hypothetical protein